MNDRKTYEYEPTDEPDIKAWLRAVTANTIHSIDGAIMVLGLKDFEYPFSTIHDCAATYAGKPMDKMLHDLKVGFIKAVSFNIWDEFRLANGLKLDAETAPPIVGNLDLSMVMESDYIFS